MALDPLLTSDTGAQSMSKINAAFGEIDGKADGSELASEGAARQSGDQANSLALAAEIQARTAAVSGEAQARSQAIASLSAEIDSEAATRAQADQQEAQQRALGDANRSRLDHVPYLQRPGDAPAFFTLASNPTGQVLALSDVPADRVEITGNGAIVVLSGPSLLTAKIATRIEPGRQYRSRYVFQRVADSIDPANDGVELGLHLLDQNMAIVGTHIAAKIIDVEIGNGRLEYVFNFAREDASNLDFTVPGAVYVRPFIRAHGYQGSGVTHGEILTVEDLSNAVDWSPDISLFKRQLASWDYLLGVHGGRLDDIDEALVASHNAAWLTSGILPDARLSPRVVFRDVDSEIAGSLTFNEILRLKNHLHVGDNLADGGGPVARITRHDNRVSIEPSDLNGGVRTDRALQFDPDAILAQRIWTALGGFRTTGTLTTTGALAVGDAAASRVSLDVYSKAEVDARFEVLDAVVRKGGIDCSVNPNYPAANAGHLYVVTVGGKIGGAGGIDVETGDALLCNVDGSAAGTHAVVGANWTVLQFNVVNPLTAAHIGVTVQAYDADLAAIAALTTTAYGRAFLALADAPAARAVIGAQEADADLAAIAALTPADGDYMRRVAGGWTNVTTAVLRASLRSYAAIATDADAVLTFAAENVRHTGTLTADRALAFDTTGSVAGDFVIVTRTGGGAFNLNVGTGPLKALPTNSWGRFVFDGAAVYLAQYGTL